MRYDSIATQKVMLQVNIKQADLQLIAEGKYTQLHQGIYVKA
jgi:hypothetical protein